MLVVGYLLTMITFGIYSFWFQMKLNRWNASHTIVWNQRLQFNGEVFDWIVQSIIVGFLTGITFGIFAPWGICRLINGTWIIHPLRLGCR